MNRSSGRAGLAISMTDEQADGRTDGQCVTTRVRSVECRVESVPLSERGRERERERGLFVQSSRAMYTELPPPPPHYTAQHHLRRPRDGRRGEGKKFSQSVYL